MTLCNSKIIDKPKRLSHHGKNSAGVDRFRCDNGARGGAEFQHLVVGFALVAVVAVGVYRLSDVPSGLL